MPDALGGPSEFGGKVQKNRVQPPPHVPNAHEKLMLLYTTGSEVGTEPDQGEVFAGLRPLERQTAIRKAEGVLEKGQEWERIRQQGEAELAALKAAEPQDEA